MPPGCNGKTREAREYLVAHGFKRSATDRSIYQLKNVRLADVARDLGFRLDALRRIEQQPWFSDNRIVEVKGLYFVVRSEVRDKNGRVIEDSLDDPNALCTVSVCINPVIHGKHLKTDSSPRMRIKSVTVPEDRLKPFQITFELSADGNTPLGLKQSQFGIALGAPGVSPRHSPNASVSFPKGTPDPIIVSPGKPVTFTVSALISYWEPAPSTLRRVLPAAEYPVCVAIFSGKDEAEGPDFDYQWVFHTWSDEYKFVVK